MRHLGIGERDQLEVALLAVQPLVARQHVGLALGLRIEVVLREAAQPRTLHVVRRSRALVARGTPQYRLDVAGVTADRLQHGVPLWTERALCHAPRGCSREHRNRYSGPEDCSVLEQEPRAGAAGRGPAGLAGDPRLHSDDTLRAPMKRGPA